MKKNKKEILDKQIKLCRKCDGLNIPKKTMSAPGYGSLNAEFFVIGQSLHSYNPNTPDQQIPFIGPIESKDSGKLLYLILRKGGYSFDKKNLFISNICHCHPPDNRSSKKEEIENCKEYLKKELEIVDPQIIMTVGRDAREWFGLSNIKGNVSYVHEKYNGKLKIFICIHHPSFILRYCSENRKEKYIKDIVERLKSI